MTAAGDTGAGAAFGDMDGLALLGVFIDTPGEFRVDIDAWRAASALSLIHI